MQLHFAKANTPMALLLGTMMTSIRTSSSLSTRMGRMRMPTQLYSTRMLSNAIWHQTVVENWWAWMLFFEKIAGLPLITVPVLETKWYNHWNIRRCRSQWVKNSKIFFVYVSTDSNEMSALQEYFWWRFSPMPFPFSSWECLQSRMFVMGLYGHLRGICGNINLQIKANSIN